MDGEELTGAVSHLIAGARGLWIDRALGSRPLSLDIIEVGDGVTRVRASAPDAASVVIELPCAIDEHFAGFGEQFTQVDKRGRIIDGWLGASVNSSAAYTFGLDGGYKIAPLVYSSAGYAALLRTTAHWRFDVGVSNANRVAISVPGEEIELLLVEGHPLEAIPRVTAITGRPPLAPPWAYGVWKNVHGDDEHVEAEARRLRAESMGASALWLFDYYEPSTNTGCGVGGTYGNAHHPDVSSVVTTLHDLGFRALTYLNAMVFKGTPLFDEAMAAGLTMKDAGGVPVLESWFHPIGGDDTDTYEPPSGLHTMADGNALIDLSDPPARQWWQAILRRILIDEGFDGWMEDFGEGVPARASLADGGTADDNHNRFPLLYHSAAFEEIQRTKPDALFFARSGYLGSVPHVPVFWPGDQTRDWSASSGLACVPAAGISIGLMGVAAWGPDIAGCMGFAGLGNGHGLGYHDKELWVRWCQLGAMTPVMREHLGFHDEAPVDAWTDEETIDTWRRCAAWHIALFPYLYGLAAEASATGLPILRGMMVHFPDDPESWVASTQYMLGDALLCAPVLEPGARSRSVYLPSPGWIDCWTGDQHDGPGWVDVPAPLDRWPVLQRPGTVVPMLLDPPLDLNGDEYLSGHYDLELRCAPGEPTGARTLHDGTVIGLRGAAMDARGPLTRRYVTATPDGRPPHPPTPRIG